MSTTLKRVKEIYGKKNYIKGSHLYGLPFAAKGLVYFAYNDKDIVLIDDLTAAEWRISKDKIVDIGYDNSSTLREYGKRYSGCPNPELDFFKDIPRSADASAALLLGTGFVAQSFLRSVQAYHNNVNIIIIYREGDKNNFILIHTGDLSATSKILKGIKQGGIDMFCEGAPLINPKINKFDNAPKSSLKESASLYFRDIVGDMAVVLRPNSTHPATNEDDGQQPEDTSSATAIHVPKREEKICIECGAVIRSDALFCTQCGKKQEAEKRFCWSCGKEIQREDTFCISCGAKQES